MKILVVTDSHGKISKLYDIIENESPEIVIWTGDYSADAEECSYAYPEIKFIIVRGNCDMFDIKHNDDEIFILENKKFLITHGHLYGVKSSLNFLKEKAIKENVDIVLYGHTHIPYYERINEIEFFNPGAFKDGYYGIIKGVNQEIKLEIKNINQ
nr:YfcE family phosphodiesterase [uncultured Cetobacterium sp.]